MYFQPVDVTATENFLGGFHLGCSACGLEVPFEIRERVTIERGWQWSAALPSDQMREKGLAEEEMIDELFAIEIAAWSAYEP
jgi:hypothetical protein